MAEPTVRPIREADVKQIHEIEKACFAMPWSEESILHDVKENVVARWLVLDDGNGGYECRWSKVQGNFGDTLTLRFINWDNEVMGTVQFRLQK